MLTYIKDTVGGASNPVCNSFVGDSDGNVSQSNGPFTIFTLHI
jgi:hypothetical protein